MPDAFLAALMGPADWVVLVVYLASIVGIGMWFGRHTHTTADFFFGGQRFPWWLVAVSCIATLVGSYSFIQYSQVAYKHGFSSLIPYTNEWFVLPIFLIGWLPIIYYNRLTSVPEYFERRFDRRTRVAVLVIMLVYLQGYIGINLLTIGQVLDSVLLESTSAPGIDWTVIGFATLMAGLSALYLHGGGQTSVLMTDLFQGGLLLVAGLSVVGLGIVAVGGPLELWRLLPPENRLPFAQFNHPPGFHFVGNFWGDAMTATFAFWMINQGVMMRFLSAKSVADGRRAMLCVVLVLMPIAAVAVGGAGWVATAMVERGTLTAESVGDDGGNAFVRVADHVCGFGLFGLVISAVVAALMSTLDTLVTAVSAIAVNDIYRLLRPGGSDASHLGIARRAAIASTALGLVMLPIFMQLGTIYQALTAVINLSIPPLIVVIVFGLLWPRFSAFAAFWTLVAGSVAILASLVFPQLIIPVAHGVDMPTDKLPFQQYSYMRGLYGVTVSLVAAIGFTLWNEWGPPIRRVGRFPLDGLTLITLDAARQSFKGGEANDADPGKAVVLPLEALEALAEDVAPSSDESTPYEPILPVVSLPIDAMTDLAASPGDLLYVSDARWWLGGLRSLHTRAGPAIDGQSARLAESAVRQGRLLRDRPVRVEKVM